MFPMQENQCPILHNFQVTVSILPKKFLLEMQNVKSFALNFFFHDGIHLIIGKLTEPGFAKHLNEKCIYNSFFLKINTSK